MPTPRGSGLIQSAGALAVLFAAATARAEPSHVLSIVIDRYTEWLGRVDEPTQGAEAAVLLAAARDIDPETLGPADRDDWDILVHNLSTAPPAALVEVEPYERALARHLGGDFTAASVEALARRELERAERMLAAGTPGAASASAVLEEVRARRLAPADAAREARARQRRARAGAARVFGARLPPPARVGLLGSKRPGAVVFETAPAIYFGRTARRREGLFSLRAGADGVASDELDALVFHETFPGHHLEAHARPARSSIDCEACTAFVEGWATYAEALAEELGLYESPAALRGRWSFLAWRAARALVDTGIHARRWSDQQATAFLREHTALSDEIIATEVRRAREVPGHGVSYVVGASELARIRAEAQAALGSRFDPRAFHAAALAAGPVPLATLERRLRAWIGQASRTAPAGRTPNPDA